LKLILRPSLIIASIFIASLSATHAQTPSATPATNAPTTNAPAAAPPVTPIALADVVTQAESVTAKLQEDQASLNPDQISHIIDENLPVLTHQIDERRSDDERLLISSPSLSNLQSSQTAWKSLAENLSASGKALTDRATHTGEVIARLDQLTKTWQATLKAAQSTSAPPEIIQRIQATLGTISDTAKEAQTDQAQIFSIQGSVAGQAARMSDSLATITKAMDTARAELFQQDHPPLWNAQAISEAGVGVVARERMSLGSQLTELRTYLAPKIGAVFVQFLLFVILAIGFYWIRKTIRSHAQEAVALQHAAQVFDVPLATALLLALLTTGWLYPDAPRLLSAAVGATALIPAVIVIRRLIETANFSILYATVIAYFVDQLRYVTTPSGVLSRFLFILEILAASIFILIALRSRHLSLSCLEQARLKRFTRIYLHFAFLVFVFAGFANIFGYVHLSILAGTGMLESSYLAVIIYAAVRIADALAISAMSIRPLSSFGMVRRHHDLLYNNVSTSIRWLAFALWLVAALQFFTLLDPLWKQMESVYRLMSVEVTWGSLSFSLDRVLRFGITLWAAFLLSRLVRFILEEEIYPHLQLARGIPYSASTMVHYTILLVGILLALESSDIDLSKFSILAGAIGVGLGFGLQNILNNFVSGLILLFERPIKVGDMVQIDTNVGKVERIGIRASVILLTNGAELIVPNGNLISNPVTNWTLSNCERLIEIPVNITSKVDPLHVMNILISAAKAHPNVIKNPAPEAPLVTFGAAGLSFKLRAWIDSEEAWMKITSDLSLAINTALARENIALA